MANKKSKSKGNKKKNQNSKTAKDNNEQPKRKANLPHIESAQDLEKLSLSQLLSLYKANEYRTEIGEICAQYTSLSLYGSKTDLHTVIEKHKSPWTLSMEEKGEEQVDNEKNPTRDDILVLDVDVNVANNKNNEKIEKYCKEVANLFPNIEQLFILYHPRFNYLLQLLFKYWNEFKVLTTICINGGSTIDWIITQFWLALRNIKSVTTLKWINPPEMAPAIKNQSEMLIQMEIVEFPNYPDDVIPLIRQFYDKLKILVIETENSKTTNATKIKYEELEKVFEQFPQTCVKLEKLELRNIEFDNKENVFELFCDRCKHLSSFTLHGLSMISVTFFLTQLSKLSNIREINFGSNLTEFTKEIAEKFMPFQSVEIIYVGLNVLPTFTVEQFRSTFGYLFPNLTALHMLCFDPMFTMKLQAEAKSLFVNMENPSACIRPMNDNALTAIIEEKRFGGRTGDFNNEDREEIHRVDEYGFRYVTDKVTDVEIARENEERD